MAKEKRAKPSTSRSSSSNSSKRGSFQDASQDGYANERGLGDDVLGLALSSQYDDTATPPRTLQPQTRLAILYPARTPIGPVG